MTIISNAFCLLVLSATVLGLGPTAVNLGTAANFAVLAQSGVSTIPKSVITGDVGLSPAAGTFLTGFSLTKNVAGTSATSTQVVGNLFAADFTSPAPLNLGLAVGSMVAAYNDAQGRSNPATVNQASGGIGGLTFAGGLYKWTSGVNIASDITLSGTALDTWIFQIAGTLTVASKAKITLTGGALPKNIVWAVAGAITIGSTAQFQGILLGKTAITFTTGSSLNGRILSQTGVALQSATITRPA